MAKLKIKILVYFLTSVLSFILNIFSTNMFIISRIICIDVKCTDYKIELDIN